MQIIFFFISILISIYINLMVFRNQYTPVLIYWWILSIIFILASVLYQKKSFHIKIRFSIKNLIIILAILLPSIIRITNYNLSRIHGDDLITAYFSATENFAKINFFSGIPSDKGQWVAQFPTMFFALQKIFFLCFGEGVLSVKLSVIPYVLIISLMLFLIIREIFNAKTAIITVILYAFLPISLYHETLGLHFVSSTAPFMIFFYFAILQWKKNRPVYSVLTGLFCGFCYLFYNTSFIAFPLMLILYFLQLINVRKLSVIGNFGLAIVTFLIVLSPYLTYALKYNNYFFSRTSQVSLLSGSWSGIKDKIARGESSTLNEIKESLTISLKSFYQDGIGGHGGYDFGHLAFFEKYSLYLFIAGAIIGIFLIFTNFEVLFIYLTILFCFSAMVFSTPPPAYHRLSLSFPFLSMILSIPFYILLSLNKTNRLIRYIVCVIFIFIYMYFNQQYFLKSIKGEEYHESLRISDYINKNFPGRNIYVASYPGFGFDKVYYFSQGKNAKSITTGYHDGFITTFNPNEKYVYAIIFPEDFNDKFQQLDPNGKIINISKGYSLFVN